MILGRDFLTFAPEFVIRASKLQLLKLEQLVVVVVSRMQGKV